MTFRFDLISFILGMAVAFLITWLLPLIHLYNNKLINTYTHNKEARSSNTSSNLEVVYRTAINLQTQRMHLAESLFALDEIAETPRLLAPPPILEPNSLQHHHRDVIEEALPYLPGYPEMAACYNAPALTIDQALSGGKNLVIIGQPGTGKTIALACLAHQIANRMSSVQELNDLIPFLIHVADLGLPISNLKSPEDFLVPIVEKVTQLSGVLKGSRLSKFVEYSFSSGRALFLLDGVDELPQAAVKEVTDFLRAILMKFPDIRVVTTGAPEYVDGLLTLGFEPLTIMPWSSLQQAHFLNKWAELWQKHVTPESWSETTNTPADAALLNRWLSVDNFSLTPLEYTLKIWAAYAGDALGGSPLDAIEAHIRRLTPSNTPPELLLAIGGQASQNESAIFNKDQLREWAASIKSSSQFQLMDLGSGLRSKLIESGLLVEHEGNRFRFSHPIFQSFLAGKSSNTENFDSLLKQPVWSGQTTTLRYMAAFNDVTNLVNQLLAMVDNILMRNTFTAARLLRDAPRDAAWRGTVMNSLVQILKYEPNPLGLRGQALAALALSGDPNTETIFRQLMTTPSDQLRQLAALGSGFVQDIKAVEPLADVLSSSEGCAREAACLALVRIGTRQALEIVARSLLFGDDELRMTAAEALANHPAEGQEALREGITNDDILVRRAIVFGLARVDEPWSIELLEKTRLHDEQWVVRNLAAGILDSRKNIDPRIPQKLTPPHENPWLIEFAGKHGMGISPGNPPFDILLLALKDKNVEYHRPALNYFRTYPADEVFSELYPLLLTSNLETREAVFQVLSELALGGALLPDPLQ